MKNKVFLGGTCNESTWRNELIPLLNIDYFNPVVEDWTPECQAEEERQKNEECNYQLYVITPKMTGVFSIAEVIESAITRNDKTIFCIIPKDENFEFDKGQLKSLNAVGNMVKKYNGIWCKSLDEIANYLNNVCLMEELSIQEKARRYNEAIEVISKCETDKYGCIIGIKPSDIFPELKESGDEKQGEQKLVDKAWSIAHSYITPNPKFFQWIYDRLMYVHNENPNVNYMLSLKERIKDMQTSWSEEDKDILFRTINDLKFLKDDVSIDPKYAINIIDIKREINWLKDLKERYTWKPSDVQMDVLLGEANAWTKGCPKQEILESLYNDLKNLK